MLTLLKAYHKHKKSSISAPFNFQHVTHTQRDHLSVLESMTDGELGSELQAASVCQAPRNQLQGIRAQSLDKDHHSWKTDDVHQAPIEEDSEPAISQDGPLARPPSITSTQEPSTMLNPDSDATSDFSSRDSMVDRPQGRGTHSSLSTEQLAALRNDHREPPAMLHPALRTQTATFTPQGQITAYELPAISLESVPEETEGSNNSPARRTSSQASDAQTQSTAVPYSSVNAIGQAYSNIPEESAPLPSNEQVVVNLENDDSVSTGESWENDVDMMYLVEAESTCNFDWNSSVHSSQIGSDGSSNQRDSKTNLSFNSISTRPSSRRNSSKSHRDDSSSAGVDSWPLPSGSMQNVTSPSSAVSPAQRFGAFPPAPRRISSTSTTNGELSPIPESKKSATVATRNRSSERWTVSMAAKHRSASFTTVDQEPPKVLNASRWSIASPLHLPEDVKSRRPNFLKDLQRASMEKIIHSGPVSPPPSAPLPKPPRRKTEGLIAPPLSPPGIPLSEFGMVHKPSSPQDRALLQAAGRIVQRGRNPRPATPTRASHRQDTGEVLIRAPHTQLPATYEKLSPVRFQVSVFPTPPAAQSQKQQEYPAWI